MNAPVLRRNCALCTATRLIASEGEPEYEGQEQVNGGPNSAEDWTEYAWDNWEWRCLVYEFGLRSCPKVPIRSTCPPDLVRLPRYT